MLLINLFTVLDFVTQRMCILHAVMYVGYFGILIEIIPTALFPEVRTLSSIMI